MHSIGQTIKAPLIQYNYWMCMHYKCMYMYNNNITTTRQPVTCFFCSLCKLVTNLADYSDSFVIKVQNHLKTNLSRLWAVSQPSLHWLCCKLLQVTDHRTATYERQLIVSRTDVLTFEYLYRSPSLQIHTESSKCHCTIKRTVVASVLGKLDTHHDCQKCRIQTTSYQNNNNTNNWKLMYLNILCQNTR